MQAMEGGHLLAFRITGPIQLFSPTFRLLLPGLPARYMGHLARADFYAEEAEWTLFLHADLPEHVRRGARLGRERHVATSGSASCRHSWTPRTKGGAVYSRASRCRQPTSLFLQGWGRVVTWG